MLPFDPRQGTLLGFELPADAPMSMAEPLAMAQNEPETALQVEPGSTMGGKSDSARTLDAMVDADAVAAGALKKPAAREKAAAAQNPVIREKATKKAPEKTNGSERVASEKRMRAAKPHMPAQAARPEPLPGKFAESFDTAKDASPEPRESKLLSPGAALASVREQSVRRPAAAPRPGGSPAEEHAARPAQAAYAFPVPAAALAASTERIEDEKPRPFDTAPPAEWAATVASLREALIEERRAAEKRWRRTRHWLIVMSAGLVVMFAASVAQTVALVSFSHRAQTVQQQIQSALNDQRAALAGLSSTTSALAARIAPAAQADSAAETPSAANALQRPVRHLHARHLK